jgi:MFS family permease
MSVWSRRLGGPRFAAGVLLDSLGSGTVLPLGILFFTLHEGMAPTTVGLGLTIGGAVSFVLAPAAGSLIDVLGPKRALLTGWVLSAGAAGSWVLVHNLLALALVTAVGGFVTGIGWNAVTILLTGASDESELPQVMATQYSLRNFGFGAGGLLSVLALAAGGIGFDLAVYANALSFLIAAALAAGTPAPPRPRVADPEDTTTIWTVLTDWRYVSLSLLGSLIAFNQTGLQVILPLWVVLRTHAPRELVGLLFTLNTVLVVTGQLWFSRSVNELRDVARAYRCAAAAMVLAGAAYVGSHLVGEAPAIVLLTAGTVALTATEMWSSAASFVVSLRLAREEHRGKYLSVWGMGWGIEGTAGPTVGTALVSAGAVLAWPVIALAVGVGSLASGAIVRSATRSVPEEPARAAVG